MFTLLQPANRLAVVVLPLVDHNVVGRIVLIAAGTSSPQKMGKATLINRLKFTSFIPYSFHFTPHNFCTHKDDCPILAYLRAKHVEGGSQNYLFSPLYAF